MRIRNLLELLHGELGEDLLVKFPEHDILQDIIVREREKSFEYLRNSIGEKE